MAPPPIDPDRASVARPTGWFCISWSDDLAPGEVRSTHAFGDRQVLYRGESGRVLAFDAFCPHQGADLAVGGWVKGDDIVCPFHAWRWDCQGQNVEIPYSQTVNRSRRLRPWPVREQDGLVYLWHDAKGGEPTWKPDSLSELTGAPAHRLDVVRVAPQMVAETALDAVHAGIAYGDPMTSDGSKADGARFSARYGGGILEVELAGLGVVIHRRTDGDPKVWATLVTPLDTERSEVRTVIAAPDGSGGARRIWRRLETDIPIWEHQRWTGASSADPDDDVVLHDMRLWAAQFYETVPSASAAPA